MIRGDQPPDGEALSIVRILEVLRDWGYPVTLGQKPALRVTGVWQSDVFGQTNPFPGGIGARVQLLFTLKADGPRLFGAVRVEHIDPPYPGTPTVEHYGILEGKVDGDRISFAINHRGRERDFKEFFFGEVSGDEIRFTKQGADGSAPMEFGARRVAAALPPSR
jgi:hypothetical protein